MPSHRGFKAWITCEDAPLKEHDVRVDEKDPDTVTCWVPSKAGKKFSVCWENNNTKKTATSGHVFIDGNDLASAIMRPERKSHVERSGVKTSSSNLRPFAFDALELTDDDNIAPPVDPSAQDIGTIRLEITRVILGAEVPFQSTNVENRGPVHEKAKKAGAHVTKFGQPQRSSKGKSAAVSNAPYDRDRTKPWVTFVFRYRSYDFLMAQDIIPNPRKRRSSPTVIDIPDDDDAEENGENPANKRIKLEAQEAFAREENEDDYLASQAPAASSPPRTDAEAAASSPPPQTGNPQFTPESSPAPAVATMVEESQTQDESQPAQDPSQTQDDDESMGDETLVG